MGNTQAAENKHMAKLWRGRGSEQESGRREARTRKDDSPLFPCATMFRHHHLCHRAMIELAFGKLAYPNPFSNVNSEGVGGGGEWG